MFGWKFKFAGLVLLTGIIFTPVTAFAQNAPIKRIEIDLSAQRLYAFEGEKKVFDFVISSGKPWWPTPSGTYRPWTKLRYDRMRGGSVKYGTYYDLPNVPYVVYFYKGYAIHGAYWHNNFGYPMSHGCVNVRPSEMALLYPWIEMNTPITIQGVTPRV